MRPSPFESSESNYELQNPSSGVRLLSTRDEIEDDDYYPMGMTEVFDKDGNVLYKMNIFVGRKKVFLSPDGSIVVLDGDVYFGQSYLRPARIEENEIVSEIYHNGKLQKEVRYATDLNNGKKLSIPRGGTEFGGGWLPREEYISDVIVDWDRNALIYTMVPTGKSILITRLPCFSNNKSREKKICITIPTLK